MQSETLDAHKAGFADAILGRKANNPFIAWGDFGKAQKYMSGYLKGEKKRKVENLISGTNQTSNS